jgi:carotenoid cleavage dioxygenase-like enzyme
MVIDLVFHCATIKYDLLKVQNNILNLTHVEFSVFIMIHDFSILPLYWSGMI